MKSFVRDGEVAKRIGAFGAIGESSTAGGLQ